MKTRFGFLSMLSWPVLFALTALTMPATAGVAPKAGDTAIVVFAAASLADVLQELGDGFTRETGIAVKFSFAASSALARQIENGAPADIFFSADIEWMDYLQARRLVDRESRRDVVGNRLVLIAPADSLLELKIEPNFPLGAALRGGRLATGDPDAVPAGRYAKAALESLGVWDGVEARLVRADSVRAALSFVDRGEVPLGIVYETDALIDKHVRIVDVFPANSHAPIVYPIALTTKRRPEAAQFIAYVCGPAGDLAFKAYGFTRLR